MAPAALGQGVGPMITFLPGSPGSGGHGSDHSTCVLTLHPLLLEGHMTGIVLGLPLPVVGRVGNPGPWVWPGAGLLVQEEVELSQWTLQGFWAWEGGGVETCPLCGLDQGMGLILSRRRSGWDCGPSLWQGVIGRGRGGEQRERSRPSFLCSAGNILAAW